jgi:hypothetical protein
MSSPFVTPLIPFSRPLVDGEACAWCYDARVVARHRENGTVTYPCTFCGEFFDDFDGKLYGEPGNCYGNPYTVVYGYYLRWRQQMLRLKDVDLHAAVFSDRQFVAERGMRARFPRAASFYDRFKKENGFPKRPYPEPVRFWVLTNPDLSTKQISPAPLRISTPVDLPSPDSFIESRANEE